MPAVSIATGAERQRKIGDERWNFKIVDASFRSGKVDLCDALHNPGSGSRHISHMERISKNVSSTLPPDVLEQAIDVHEA
jgi:hypothetical protein